MYTILKTKKKGNAVFANKTIKQSTYIGEYYRNTPTDLFRKNIVGWYDRELGRYCNHVHTPNTYLVEVENGYDLYSSEIIKEGDEIGVNYIEMEDLANVKRGTFYRNYFIPDKLINFGSGNINNKKLVY